MSALNTQILSETPALQVFDNHITVQAAAEITGYNAQYLRRKLRAGRMESIRIGQIWLVNLVSLQAYFSLAISSNDLRLMAKYADATKLFVGSPCGNESFRVLARKGGSYAEWLNKIGHDTQQKLGVLKRHCETFARPYEEIGKSSVTYIKVGSDGITTAKVLQLCHDFAILGFQYVIFVILNCHEVEPLSTLERRVIPSAG